MRCISDPFIFPLLQMAYYRVNPSNILCISCELHLGSSTPHHYCAKFHYCEKCDKAHKIHPDCEFLRNWDEDIFQEPFADFTLEGSDGGIVRAHKAVLAGKSKVFKAMLRAGMSESVNGKVNISDMTAGELKPLNDFLYSGKVNQESLECHGVALYRASVKYDLPLLTAICERFLESNAAKDIRGVFELAVDYEVNKFQEAVLPFIFSEGFVERNSPVLVMKTLRAASKFECFAAYREKNLKTIPSLMETAFYRAAGALSIFFSFLGYLVLIYELFLEKKTNMLFLFWCLCSGPMEGPWALFFGTGDPMHFFWWGLKL